MCFEFVADGLPEVLEDVHTVRLANQIDPCNRASYPLCWIAAPGVGGPVDTTTARTPAGAGVLGAWGLAGVDVDALDSGVGRWMGDR